MNRYTYIMKVYSYIYLSNLIDSFSLPLSLSRFFFLDQRDGKMNICSI